MAIPVPYNTNLSEAQIAEAFRRALNDLTDEQITDLLAQKLSITDIDAELSEESENPVQNKAVTVRLSCIESEQESQGAALDEDRAALVELVDGGAKNLIQNRETTRTVSGVTFTVNSDGSVSLSGTASANITSYLIVSSQSIFDESCVLSGCPSGGSDGTYKLDMLAGGGGGGVLVSDYGTGALIDWTLFVSGTFSVRIRIANGTDTTGLIFKPMLCTKAAWDISHQYVPHRPSYDELIARIEALEGGM